MLVKLAVTTLLVLGALKGAECIKCKVGVSPLLKDMDCKGAWSTIEAKLAGIGGKMANITHYFNFGSKSERRRRAADNSTATNPPAAAAEDPNEYYCLKHSLLRSCAPKDKLNIAKALCKKSDTGETCACNDKDFCNSGTRMVGGFVMIMVTLLTFF